MKSTALIALAGFAGVAGAQTFAGAGGAFPDNGGPGNPLISDIIVADTGGILDLNVSLLGATHTFVGDLIISVTHVDTGTSVTLVDRPGVPDFSVFGWAYDLGGDYTFDDDASTTWQDVNGGVQDTAFVIATGSYLGEGALSAFNGIDLSGTWRLSISDNAGADTGQIQGWSITAVVPSPASVAMLGMGGLVAARRRR